MCIVVHVSFAPSTVAVPCTSSSAPSTDMDPHPPTLPGEFTLHGIHLYKCSMTASRCLRPLFFIIVYIHAGASCSVATGEEKQTTCTSTIGCDMGGVEGVASGGMGRKSGRVNPRVGRRRGREKAVCVSQ